MESEDKDIGWKYGKPWGSGTICKYCDKHMKSGGVSRLKDHLIGVKGKDVSKCPKCPQEIRDLLKKHKEEKERLKKQKSVIRDRQMEEIQRLGEGDCQERVPSPDNWGEGYGDEERMQRHVAKQTAASRWEIDQMERERLHMRDSHVGQSSRGEEDQQRGKRKTIESMLHNASMRVGEAWPREPRLSTSDVARQPSVKSMFQGGIREKVGKAISKFIVMNNVSANVVKDRFFENMIEEVRSGGHGIKLPTPREVLGKYLDEFVKETRSYVQSLEPLWASHGCSLLCDGWTGPTKMNIINL